MASAVGAEIPEADFLALKQRHHIKVAVSRHLDKHPATSISLLRIRIWLRDNWSRNDSDS